MELRQATRIDETEVRRCVTEAYDDYLPVMGKMPALVLDDYATLIASGATYVAEVEGVILGVLVAWPEIDHLYLADDLARANDRGELRLVTNEAMTSNLDFYPRRGFTETHRAVDNGYRCVYFRRLVAR